MSHRRLLADHESHSATMRCIADDTGRLVYVSPALGWSLGLDADALVGTPLASIMDLNTPEQLHDIRSGYYDATLLRQSKSPVTLPARLDQALATQGKHYTIIWLDPAQKQDAPAQKSTAPDLSATIGTGLRSDESELRHFLDMTPDLWSVHSHDLSFVRFNTTVENASGYTETQLTQIPFTDIIHPEDRESTRACLQPLINAPPGEVHQTAFSNRLQTKDGHIRWMEWLCKTAENHIYILGKDVTDTRQHEHELNQREQQLQEAQKIGRMGHWTWKINTDSMTWSDQIYTIFGVDRKTFTPTIDIIRGMILKSDLNRIFKAYQLATLRKKNFAIEFKIRRNGGLVRYIRCEGGVKSNPVTGETTALFGIMQDITERTLHERALRAAKESAESAYASKTRFLANMSHELRTPLNAIIGFSEMIQRQLLGPVGNTRYLDYVGGIRESGEHLLDLINDILDMSKIEVGKYELYVEEMNLGKLIRLAIHMIEGRAHEARVRLITTDIPEDIHVIADRRALMQILLNLLSNAVKFTPEKGEIEISCGQSNQGITLTIRDTGIGIPMDKIDLVTQPFEQVDNIHSRKHKGSGLGLAITKDLIELHKGHLDIKSESGKGTTVTVTLPGNTTGQ